MGAMQPVHLLVLFVIAAMGVAVLVTVVVLIALAATRSTRPAPLVLPPSAPQPSSTTLTELAALHAQGTLTDAELAAAKRKLLDV
ncbi:hypothetical protein GCM10028784_38700 [Myceligenerans cantabricum]